MIDVSKCLEALRDYRRFGFGMIGGPDKKVAAKDVIEVIEGLEDHIRDLTNMVPKWISVEERLPEDNVNVLVYAIGNNEPSVIAMTGYTHNMYGYNIEGWRAPWQYFFHEYKITHWMPLPERPERIGGTDND